jgi:alpha-amylase
MQIRALLHTERSMHDTNGVMMQYFHWYLPNDGSLWRKVASNATQLAKLGVSSLWLPPAYKGIDGASDVGYAAYDLFDLGEFDQKGSVRTKYGTREEFLLACAAARDAGIRVYADAVFNHKLGGDAQEAVNGTPYDIENRQTPLSDVAQIDAWTRFEFAGRGTVHSSMKWHSQHFSAVDYDHEGAKRVLLLSGKQFADDVDGEKGNFDFLMGCDVDVSHPDVRAELEHWGEWFVTATGVDGFRFDAVKHVNATFFRDWLKAVEHRTHRDLFGVGEYWSQSIESLRQFIHLTDGAISLFDVPLHTNFHHAGVAGDTFDLRTIFANTLVQADPTHAVTFVDNHDSQPLQSLESAVDEWFKPLAYALILLRREGYPCIFYPDFFGAAYRDAGDDGVPQDIELASHSHLIQTMLRVRQEASYGEQTDYFDEHHCIGWTRSGATEHPGGVAVVISNGDAGSRWMQMPRANHAYYDACEHVATPVQTNDDGFGNFSCQARSVSVWVLKTDDDAI